MNVPSHFTRFHLPFYVFFSSTNYQINSLLIRLMRIPIFHLTSRNPFFYTCFIMVYHFVTMLKRTICCYSFYDILQYLCMFLGSSLSLYSKQNTIIQNNDRSFAVLFSIQIWDQTKPSNVRPIQPFQSMRLRQITETPRYMSS